MFVISPWQVQKALTHDVRFEKADVSYSWPGVMRVKITERRPAVYLACSYNGYAKVDYTGVVMEVSDGIRMPTLLYYQVLLQVIFTFGRQNR